MQWIADRPVCRSVLFVVALVASFSPDAVCCADQAQAIATWAARAETFYGRIKDKDDQAIVDAALAVMYAQQHDADKALAAARRVVRSDSKAALSQLSDVAYFIAEHLPDDAARQLLQSITDPLQQKSAALRVFMVQGAAGKLAAAQYHAPQIKDIEARNEAWMWFAVGANGARKFDAARAALREMDVQTGNWRQRRQGMRQAIERREAELEKKPPTAQQLWEKAENSGASSHWREAAIAYWKNGNNEESRDGLTRAEAAGETIDFYSIKVANLTLIAHAYLQMDEPQQASRVAKKALRVLQENSRENDDADDGAAFDLEGLFGGLFVSPALISILAGSGEMDLALKFAKEGGQWVAVGGGGLSPQRQTELHSQLAGIDSPRDQALVCIGVAQGLLQSRANTPP